MPHRHRSIRLATQAMDLGLAVPEVVARRVARMVSAGSSASAADREELLRMSAEKISAFHESWNAMFLAVCRANLRLFPSAQAWTALWLGQHHRARSAEVHHAMLDILVSGVTPIHRRVIANAKRLRR